MSDETIYRVACSPLTDTIYAGRVKKDGKTWTSKSDVTTEACVAVARHVQYRHGGAMELRADDGSGWDIEVTQVDPSSSSLSSHPSSGDPHE